MIANGWQDLIGTPIAERYTLRNLVYADRNQAEFLAVAREDGQTLVSVALVHPEPAEIEHELTAINRARQLQHANILKILDGGECILEDTKLAFIVTEAAQGTLATAPRPDLNELLEDLLAPLEWLHSQNLVYRNLDPETIVRADGHWKLGDLSQVHAAGQFDATEASGRNAPPEAVEGRIAPAWDIWSMGVLLRNISEGQAGRLPAPFDAIVRGCMEMDYRRRLSPKGIRGLLKPEPAAPLIAVPRLEAPRIQEALSRFRVPLMALAAIAVLAGVLFLMFRTRRESPPPQVAPAPAAVPAPKETGAPPTAGRPSAFPGKAPRAAPAPSSKPAAAPNQLVGRADYFSDGLEGHQTASGEKFSNSAMTAATRQFPLGTRLRITNLKTKRSVTVRVNDRGPARHGIVVTVTRRAAEELGVIKDGSARVKVERVK